MDTESIVQALKMQRDGIINAIAALEGTEIHGRKTRTGKRKGVQRLSAAAKRRISEAAKARWALAKKSGKNRL